MSLRSGGSAVVCDTVRTEPHCARDFRGRCSALSGLLCTHMLSWVSVPRENFEFSSSIRRLEEDAIRRKDTSNVMKRRRLRPRRNITSSRQNDDWR